MVTRYKKNKEKLLKKTCEGYQIFLKKKVTKIAKILLSNMEVFLMKKKRLVDYINNSSIM